jgi:hypothetical protein
MWPKFLNGNKSFLRDLTDGLDGDLWTWVQCVSTVVLIAVIVLASLTVAAISFIIWIILNMFAMWKTYKLEQK